MERKIDLLEKILSEADERVGEISSQNRLLKQEMVGLQHQLTDKSRELAVLEQAEEKFVSLERQTVRLTDEREKLHSQVEQLLRKVASLKAALLQLD